MLGHLICRAKGKKEWKQKEIKKEGKRDKGKRKARRLTAFKLHGTRLNVHWEILQVHRAGQDKSQPEIEKQIEREKRSHRGQQEAQKDSRKRHHRNERSKVQ